MSVLYQADRLHVGAVDDRHHDRVLDHVPAVEMELELHTAQERVVLLPDTLVIGGVSAQGLLPAVGVSCLFHDMQQCGSV